jgi:hypothetical protein
MGGLGNMMFQIATGEYWYAFLDVDVVYTNMAENLFSISREYTPKRDSLNYKKLFCNFDWDEATPSVVEKFTPRSVPFYYIPIKPQDGIEYIGYFQSYKNFPNGEFVVDLFRPSEFVKEGLTPVGNNSCSIHVRRQDYLKHPEVHPALDMEYYENAMAIMRDTGVEVFYVFSDDAEWVRHNFHFDDTCFYCDVNEYTAMYMMSLCDHNIIANSSLSWWGAYLGDQENRVVVAPDKWFGSKGPDASDIVPPNWIKT